MQATALSPRSLRLRRGCCVLPPMSGWSRPCGAATRRRSRRSTTATTGRCWASAATCWARTRRPRTRSSACSSPRTCTCRDGTAHVNLKPWLYTIARNRCLSMLRARRETLALDDVHEPSCAGLALADEVELGEDLKQLLGDIARLPDDQRAALVLAELGDLSQQEIAATLDVRTDKVKALIFQAREALAGWRQARDGELPRDLRAALDAEGERAAPRPDPPPPRGVPGMHGLRGRGQAPARRALAAAPGGSRAWRSSTACSPPRSPPAARRAAAGRRRARSGDRAPARPGSPSRRWWWPHWRSAQAAAAWSPCASSSSPGRSSALGRRRRRAPAAAAVAAPAVAPAGRLRAGSGSLRRRSRRRAGRQDGTPSRGKARGRSRAAEARGRGRAGSGRPHAPPPAGCARRNAARRPRAGGAAKQRPVVKTRPAPATSQRPLVAKPPASSPRRSRRLPRAASRPPRAERPTFVAATRLRGHEDPHHTLADRRPRPQHHRIRGRLDSESCPDHPVGFQAVPHRAIGDGPRALPPDLRDEQEQAQRLRQVRLQAHAGDHRGRQGGQAERLQGVHRRGDRRSGRLHAEVRHRQARRQRPRQVRVAEGQVQDRQDRGRPGRGRRQRRQGLQDRAQGRPGGVPRASTAPARTSATPSASASRKQAKALQDDKS